MEKMDIIRILKGLGLILVVLGACGSAQHIPPPGEAGPNLPLGSEFSNERAIHGERSLPMGVPVEMVISGRGFALQGNKTHLLRLSVVRLAPMEPGRIRSFLISNKSVAEIREAIRALEGQAFFRGNLMLDNVNYPMMDIAILHSKNNSTTIDSNIAMPGADITNQTISLGRLMVEAFISKGGAIGQGRLEINSTEHKGSYQVLLDMDGRAIPFERKRGWRGHA